MPKAANQSSTAAGASAQSAATVAALVAYLEGRGDGGCAAAVEHIETHLSHVLLTEDHVYKLLKPVRFAFVDFSTVERRRAECQAEVELNRPLAPGVYLSAAPVVRRANGAIEVAKETTSDNATIVDWVVVMRRLPAEQTLEALVLRGAADESHVEGLMHALCAFYGSAKRPTLTVSEYSTAFERHIRENLAELSHAEHGLAHCVVRRVHAAQLGLLAFGQDQLEKRITERRIVEGHGDLRPEHVYFTPRPVVIDCVAFSREFRTVDIADEVAFLAMELRLLGAEPLASGLVDAYQSQAKDQPTAILWAFYQAYRACVRAKVAVLRAAQIAEPDQSKQRKAAREYLELADHALRPFYRQWLKPTCVVVRGLSGTGKSTLAAALAEKLGAVHLQTDVVRRRLFPKAEPTGYGQGCYTSAARALVYDAMRIQAREVLAQGSPVVLDGTFLSAESRQKVADLAVTFGVSAVVLNCVCPAEVARERINNRAAQGDAVSDATLPTLSHQQGEEEPDPAGVASAKIQTTQSLCDQLAAAIAALRAASCWPA